MTGSPATGANAAKLARRGRPDCQLHALPFELLEVILWHCAQDASAAIATTCHPMRAAVQTRCWADDAWMASRVPLRFLLPLESASDSVCLRRLALHPEEAVNLLGRYLPLHRALEIRPEATALHRALLAAHPAAIREKCSALSMLPIEYAAELGVPSEVVDALIEAHHELDAPVWAPPYARQLTALHLAIINGASSGVVNALLHVAPEAASLWGCENALSSETDLFTDLLPLHLAAVYGPSLGEEAARVVEALAARTPCALATREGRHGMLPLHLAALSGAPLEALVALARHFPHALQVADDYGRTPLECARARARALGGPTADGTLPPGYSYRVYEGFNPETLPRLVLREGVEWLAAGVACLETLSAALSAGVVVEDEASAPHKTGPPTTIWRYSYDEVSYGSVLPEGDLLDSVS